MDKKIIEQIIERGTHAVSGDNSQPWKFEVRDNEITILNIPDRDNPMLNVRQRGSYVAHGSLIETMCIASIAHGFIPHVALLPEKNRPEITAKIVLTPGSMQKDPLYEYIEKRASNRRAYDPARPITPEQKQKILETGRSMESGRVVLVEDTKVKKCLGTALSGTEKVALTTKELHKLFFKDMIWTEREEHKKKHGLYIRTLEIPPPVRILFRLIRHWPIMSFFNALGFYKFAAAGNAQTYSSCSALGAIIVPNTDEAFITAGRALQRIWLTAEKLGLAMQVVTGIPFLYQRLMQKQEPFTPWQTALIRESYKKLQEIFGTREGEIIAMPFRIGYAPPPSARSSRLPPIITFHAP